jgi:hypothetical protein
LNPDELGLAEPDQVEDDEMRYQCSICDEEPMDSVTLIAHMEECHGEDTGDCPICLFSGTEVTYYEELIQHLHDAHEYDYGAYQESMGLTDEQLMAAIIQRSKEEYAS